MAERSAAAAVTAFLGLGSNLGDRAALLRAAVEALEAAKGVTVTAASAIYETPPWGPVPQGPYLNACIAVATTLAPRALLDLALAIERQHGRERAVRWGPRTLDIDLLTYGTVALDEPGLILPHPRLTERAFVLLPLSEFAAGHGIGGRSVADWLALQETDAILRRDDLGPLRG